MAKAKSGKSRKLFSPFLLSLAAMTGWAATHEPEGLADPGTAGAWLLASFAVGLLVRALLAILAPFGKLCADSLRLLLGNFAGPGQGGADT